MAFGTSGGRKLVGAFDGEAITSNGGAVLLGADAADGSVEEVAHIVAQIRKR